MAQGRRTCSTAALSLTWLSRRVFCGLESNRPPSVAPKLANIDDVVAGVGSGTPDSCRDQIKAGLSQGVGRAQGGGGKRAAGTDLALDRLEGVAFAGQSVHGCLGRCQAGLL